jgi:hypothetical protein
MIVRRFESALSSLTVTDAAPDLNPVMTLIVSLLAAATVTDDRVEITNRASAQHHRSAICGPGILRVALPIGKWDKENRSNEDSAQGVTCPDLKPKAESSPPHKKVSTGKEYRFRWLLLGLRFRGLAG